MSNNKSMEIIGISQGLLKEVKSLNECDRMKVKMYSPIDSDLDKLDFSFMDVKKLT